MIRTAIVHEIELVCGALANVLRAEDDIEIVGVASHFPEALKQLNQTPCDLVLLNANQLSRELFLFIQQVVQRNEHAPRVLVIGLSHEIDPILELLDAGASAYALQDDSLEELLRKMRALCQGRVFVSPEITFALIEQINRVKREVKEEMIQVGSVHYPELTPREMEILWLLTERYTNREIAQQLTIETGTVKNHVHNILQKLNVSSRRAAAAIARDFYLDSTA